MTDKEKVKAIYPNAVCRPDAFGIQWEVYDTDIPDNNYSFRNSVLKEHLLSTSTISENCAWEYAWRDVQEKMLKKMES